VPPTGPSTLLLERAEEAGLYWEGEYLITGGRGSAVADVNGDGWPDIYLAGTLPGGGSTGRLLINRGDGTFEDKTEAWGLDWHGLPGLTFAAPTFADIDNDGDPDLLLAAFRKEAVLLNNGDHFVNISSDSGLIDESTWSVGMSLADFNGDGTLDVVVLNHLNVGVDDQLLEPPPHDLIFEGNGDGTFTDRSDWLPRPEFGGASFGGGWVDFDKDGDPDLYLVNDHGGTWTPNQLYRNDGPTPDGWSFTSLTESCSCNLASGAMGLAVGDYNRDLKTDFFIANLSTPDGAREVLLQGQGDGTFVDVSLAAGAAVGDLEERQSSWGTEFLDYNNDGWPDLFVAFGGDPTGVSAWEAMPSTNLLLKNVGGTFEPAERSGIEGLSANSLGVAKLDFDLDGCIDLLVNNLQAQPELLHNQCDQSADWIGFQLIGTITNRDGIGARVRVHAGDIVQEDQPHAGTTSHSSSSWKRVHFGLGEKAPVVDWVEVSWPSGIVDSFEDVDSGAYYRITEGEGLVRL